MSKFDIKQKLDNVIFYTYNILSNLVFSFSFSARAKLRSNLQHKNRHAGMRCFIIGTGPSINGLSKNQISRLNNEITIGVNSFYKINKLDGLSPNYYALLDNNYWGVTSYAFKEIVEKYSENPPVFLTDIRAVDIIKRIERNVDFIALYAKYYPVRNGMHCNAERNFPATLNVVSASILVAMYLGFKEIYLLGCDYDLFCAKAEKHCYNDDDEWKELPKYNLAFYLKYYHLTTEYHYLIAKLADENGVDIVNLTDGTLLDAYRIEDASVVLS